MIIYKFTRQILSGEPIPDIRPDPARDFTYVSDIVDGLAATLALPRSTYEVLNLGCGRPIRVSRSIEILEKLLAKKAVRGPTVPPPPSDVPVTHASSARARALLGWKPKVRFEDGVKRFVDWYVSNRDTVS